MTAERIAQLKLHSKFTGLEKGHALDECLDEIERLRSELFRVREVVSKEDYDSITRVLEGT